ncbi:hypothetical protein [Bacillus pumilus]|uniref:hypothetical protein n=1 Tax=Bacillus pumilus TaxID=1408 RepID=UPI0016426F53|nr:hypothetical protein [Bacillus pumilus]
MYTETRTKAEDIDHAISIAKESLDKGRKVIINPLYQGNGNYVYRIVIRSFGRGY